MRCELHGAEMEARHYKHGDVARCPRGCVEQGPPGTFQESVTPLERKCAYPVCDATFLPDRYNPSQQFHTRGCRQASYRLRRGSGGSMEVG